MLPGFPGRKSAALPEAKWPFDQLSPQPPRRKAHAPSHVAPRGPTIPPSTSATLAYATKRIRRVFEIQKDFAMGLSVSPDGRWILYSQVGEVNSDIMLVDHFR